MSELRLNLITMQWVIIQSDGKKPEEIVFSEDKKKITEKKKDCPFCPGNEHMTEKPKLIIGGNGNWRIRVIPNKYPVLSEMSNPKRYRDGLHVKMDGAGVHELIIEDRKHNSNLALLSKDGIMENLLAYRERYEELVKIDYIKQVIIFKNHGDRSGSSIEHPHSHIVGLPVVSTETRKRMERAMYYYEQNGSCIFCDLVKQELKDKNRIISETENFVAFIPYAALSPFHTWIIPKNHACSFMMIDDEHIIELASIIKDVFSRFHIGLNDPSYNLVVRSLPSTTGGLDYFHWYFSLVPRLVRRAGFEMGSGMYINPSIPEECAEFLRNINIEQ